MFRYQTRRFFQTSSRNVAFAFDIDGVLIRGSKVIPQAPTALKLLNQHNIPYILLTNGGGMTEKERVVGLNDKLGNGINIDERQFLQSHTPFQLLKEQYNRVLVVGGDGDKCRHAAKNYGFRDVVMTQDIIKQVGKPIWPFHRFQQFELDQVAQPQVDLSKPFDAVLVFNDPRDMATDLQIIMDLLVSENGVLGTRRLKESPAPSIPIHFSNNDLLWANSYSLPRFGQGAFRVCVESIYKEVTGHQLERTIIGKPFAATYQYADKMLQSWGKLGQQTPTVYMVGDNPASDIAGANAYGWKSMLVRTGVYKDSDVPVAKPDYIFDNVLDAVQFGIGK